MDSKSTSSAALFLSINLVLFALVSGCDTCPQPKSKPTPTPTPANPNSGSCPIDALKLGVCANVLSGLVGVVIGTPPDTPCCALLDGLLDLEAAICLCTAIKANILGINLDIHLSLSLLINTCGKTLPKDFQCA
ncbi:hypothetical protein VitviT2T_002189 [Vitis vinifera]|uniref:14 kDa proline-rich protein DC2.15 n=2 Tax=Vitis vinifera TaxID=29760 RepID=F6HPA1_VITVI|nr:14 kDa proline-rich protein DC2.15 [Vitis vinifera]RVW50638.1 14 kDa proline-rich protein DC2.15 [Vitis vinifera]WJZ82427.1 hypothetical protein VitviT2T_002189 [Vitis vinifera]|eukprot:XP_002271619.1 PREDICTED: 14 kDa proline-rich protein DC2.15 [Vitis vinifera]